MKRIFTARMLKISKIKACEHTHVHIHTINEIFSITVKTLDIMADLSLFDNIIWVTSGKPSTLQQIHDISFSEYKKIIEKCSISGSKLFKTIIQC